jgi:hypothetical protein
MKRYAIYTDTFEIRFGPRYKVHAMTEDEISAAYWQEQNDPLRRESFDTQEGAKSFFSAHYADYPTTRLYKHVDNAYYLVGELAWLEEQDTGEDDVIQQADIVEEMIVPYTPDAADEED